MVTKTAAEIFRDYETDGVPASGPHLPIKSDIRGWGALLETISNVGAGLAYPTIVAINADLAHPGNTFAIVYADATASNNGMYVKSGSSGAGSWTRVGDLPTSVVRFTVTGGTANAIIATSVESPSTPGSKLFLMTPTASNTGATTINGTPVKTALGSDLVAGSFVAGSAVLMSWEIDHYQLLISLPVDGTGVLNDVLAARDAASASATAAAGSESALANQVHQYDTRALAIAATIPAGVNFVRTLAYDSSFTEDSGALFKRIGAGVAFTDTWPTAGSIAGGLGYTDGTYNGVFLSGTTTGRGLVATITVSGGAVTAVDFSTQPGNAYKAGDVLSCSNTAIGGTGSGFTFTISTISAPLASFVNTVDSSRWQYMQSKGFTHVNEFGSKPDWTGADGSATNNFATIQAALFFRAVNLTGVTSDAGGYEGGLVKLGIGTYLLMHPTNTTMLIVPGGVWLEGAGGGGSTLRFSDAWYAATHRVALGNPSAHFANFNCGLRYVRLSVSTNLTTALGTFVVYSNNIQDGSGMKNCYIYSGQCGGIKYELGWGGASTVVFEDLSLNCAGPDAAANFNVGTTIVNCKTWSVNAPSSGTNNTNDAVVLTGTGGMYSFDGIHIEGFQNGFLIDLRSGNNPNASFKNCDGGFNLAQVFKIQGTGEAGTSSFERCQKAGAATLVTNGQAGGTSRSADILPKDGIVSFNP